MVHTVFKRVCNAKTKCESTLNCQRSRDGFLWQCSQRKIAMDEHQSARFQLHESKMSKIIHLENFAGMFNLSADA